MTRYNALQLLEALDSGNLLRDLDEDPRQSALTPHDTKE